MKNRSLKLGFAGQPKWDCPVTINGICRSLRMRLSGHLRWDYAMTLLSIDKEKMIDHTMHDMLTGAIAGLSNYCKRSNWSGYDPYDGLNSRIFSSLPFLHNRIGRLILIQTLKRNPVNLRPMLLVPASQSPKGIALFSSALIKLSDLELASKEDALLLLKRLIDLKSPNTPYYCWGYNFDWQQRVLLVPKYTPNIICTTFAGNALIDAYEKFGDSSYIETASSAGDFILNGLNIKKMDKGICFSYTPLDHAHVHNANFLGAVYLARLYKLTGEQRFIDPAFRAMKYSISKQNPDGSWYYGEYDKQKWIDNFHTGYNLGAINKFCQYTGETDFHENVKNGFEFYRKHFFSENGIAKYYHDRIYPIDIHSIAQSIVTLVELKALNGNNIDLALSIFKWSNENMLDKDGYFYYQKKRFYTNKISYMRWSQAWMLYALAILLKEVSH